MQPKSPSPFHKPWNDFPQLLDLFEKRGVAVPDRQTAIEFLSHVNYYRLSGYCVAFEVGGRHTFASGITFDDIRRAYDFDFELRDLLSEALEVIEIDVRTILAYHLGGKYGAFGHTDPTNFYQLPKSASQKANSSGKFIFDHAEWLKSVQSDTKRSKELFVTHFKDNYNSYPNLPLWIATEVISFGSLSKMCSGLKNPDRRIVASRYGVQPGVLESWAHHLSVVRNHCAHHSRVWDRLWSVKAELPAGNSWRMPHLADNTRLGMTLLVLHRLLSRCPAAKVFTAGWRARIMKLIDNPPRAPRAREKMGLTPNWENGPEWQTAT
jgi:abortive infection bacteriophage resistance protein